MVRFKGGALLELRVLRHKTDQKAEKVLHLAVLLLTQVTHLNAVNLPEKAYDKRI
jgi:uncharacterized membrane protein YsdA (DUF1294 family)